MNKTPAQLWVEALRSGEFKQCTDWLRTPDGYCCLGVLCEVFHRETGTLAPELVESRQPHFKYGLAAKELPTVIREWVGLADSAGRCQMQSEDYGALASANDSGASFEEIADIIESRPPGLFVESEP